MSGFQKKAGSTEWLNQQLKDVFHLAAQRHLAKALCNMPSQAKAWRRVNAIMREAHEARRTEKAIYIAQYDTRVEMARRDLLNKSAGNELRLTDKRVALERFDNNALLRQAHRQVRSQHLIRLDHIDEREGRELERVLDRLPQQVSEQLQFKKQNLAVDETPLRKLFTWPASKTPEASQNIRSDQTSKHFSDHSQPSRKRKR